MEKLEKDRQQNVTKIEAVERTNDDLEDHQDDANPDPDLSVEAGGTVSVAGDGGRLLTSAGH